MSNTEMAAYLVQLPLSEFKAIRKAISVVARGGMCREEALKLIVTQHAESRNRALRAIEYK